jgi:hypothetical protein
MFARENLDLTLGKASTLLKEREDGTEKVRVKPDDIEFHLSSTTPTIVIGEKEVPGVEGNLNAFGDLLQVPTAFLKRAKDKVQGETLDALMTDLLRNTLLKDAQVALKGDYVQGVTEWGKTPIETGQVLQAATKVLGEDAQVHRWIDSPSAFGFDVHVDPDKAKKGFGGDGTKTTDVFGTEVNDITAGGVRFGLNLKQGLAPDVSEILYRLACTNGMTVPSIGLKIDARGQTVDEVLAEVESMAQVAFSRVERSIEAFYEMKNQKVDNVERTLRRIARERSIPDRSMVALMDLAVTDDMPEEPSMFDVVNLVTNFANSPSVNRDGGRLILEGAGGAAVADHAARCDHCQQKVG